jgi:hypothetical protein
MTHSYRASGTPFVVSATNSALRTHVPGSEPWWCAYSACAIWTRCLAPSPHTTPLGATLSPRGLLPGIMML